MKKLTPNFAVKSIKETVEFYCDILGFKLEMAVSEGKDDIVQELVDGTEYVYAIMSNNNVDVMFQRIDSIAEDIPSFATVPLGASVSFYIEVENVNELYERLHKKIEVVKKLETTWYGMREFYIRDCNSYILGFAQKVVQS